MRIYETMCQIRESAVFSDVIFEDLKRNTIRKVMVSITTIVGAGALSIKKLKYTPKIAQKILVVIEIITISLNWLVNKCAIAPGAISAAMTKIIPTAFKAPTIVIDNKDKRQ